MISGSLVAGTRIRLKCLTFCNWLRTRPKKRFHLKCSVLFKQRGLLFHFQTLTDKPVMRSDYNQAANFDWRVGLAAGSKRMVYHYRDYRILSIKNELTDFAFTKLHFPFQNIVISGFLIAGGSPYFPALLSLRRRNRKERSGSLPVS